MSAGYCPLTTDTDDTYEQPRDFYDLDLTVVDTELRTGSQFTASPWQHQQQQPVSAPVDTDSISSVESGGGGGGSRAAERIRRMPGLGYIASKLSTVVATSGGSGNGSGTTSMSWSPNGNGAADVDATTSHVVQMRVRHEEEGERETERKSSEPTEAWTERLRHRVKFHGKSKTTAERRDKHRHSVGMR
jgi:hypothetical protein